MERNYAIVTLRIHRIMPQDAHGTATLPARTTVASSAQRNCVWQIKLTLQRLLSPLAWSLSAAFCRRRVRVCTVVIAVRRSRSKLVSARKSSSSSRELSCQRRRCAVTSTPLARLSTRQIEASASASVPILATIRALSIAAIVCLDRSSPSVIRLPNSVSAGGYNKQKCRLAMGALKMQNLKMTDKYYGGLENTGLETDGPIFASHTSRKNSTHLVKLKVF